MIIRVHALRWISTVHPNTSSETFFQTHEMASLNACRFRYHENATMRSILSLVRNIRSCDRTLGTGFGTTLTCLQHRVQLIAGAQDYAIWHTLQKGTSAPNTHGLTSAHEPQSIHYLRSSIVYLANTRKPKHGKSEPPT